MRNYQDHSLDEVCYRSDHQTLTLTLCHMFLCYSLAMCNNNTVLMHIIVTNDDSMIRPALEKAVCCLPTHGFPAW